LTTHFADTILQTVSKGICIMIKITDKYGYIVDAATRRRYDRIISQPGFCGERPAEAFLRLVERYATRGIRLFPEERDTGFNQ
jgi:hypothetical protein